jgi:hypothetical protein
VFGWYVFEAVEVTMKVNEYDVKLLLPTDDGRERLKGGEDN